jgi:glycosyltransferase involved in cell wall biosynthesis
MKIALYHNLPPGGAKRAVYEEVRWLIRRHKVNYFKLSCTDESFLDIRKYVENTYEYNFSININARKFQRLVKDYKTFISLDNLHKNIADNINSNNYDICLIHPDFFTQAPFILRHLKIPSLYFCEEYLRIAYEKELEFNEDVNLYKKVYENVTRKIRKIIDKNNACSATKMLANSFFTESNIEKAFGVKTMVCQLGVNPEIFKRTNKKVSEYILFIGDKSNSDDSKLVINSLSKLSVKKKIQLKILGLKNNRLTINNDRILADIYSGAVALVCTQKNEPFGIAPLEAMACETPVLVVNEGGYRETVIDGVTGYLLPRDCKIFAEKIEYLIEHPDVASKMGKAGRAHVIKNFTWDKHCGCVEKHLLKLLNENK